MPSPTPAPLPALPEVVVNFALTWDARVSTRNRTLSDFSSARDKRRLLEIRASADAVLVGRGTMEAERMRRLLPDAELRAARVAQALSPEPLYAVVSGSGRFDLAFPFFTQPSEAPTCIFTTPQMPPETHAALLERGFFVYTLEAKKAETEKALGRVHELKNALEQPEPKVDLKQLLEILARNHSVRRVVCEGGPGLLRSLLAADLADELYLTFCPRIFGGEHAPTLTGLAGDFLPQPLLGQLTDLEIVENEAFACYRLH